MLRKALGRIFSSRVFYIIFSLIASIALWMYVEITQYSEDWHEVANVPIEYINKELLRDRNLLISSVGTQNLTLRFLVPRAVAAQLTSSTVSAVVNLEGITRTGVTYARYDINLPPGVILDQINNITRSVGSIALNVDRLSTTLVDVRVDYRGGTASEDLIVDPVQYEPQIITVSGPEDTLLKIGAARVQVNRANLSTTISEDFEYTLLDENGDEMEESLLDSLDFSHELIHVTVPIKQIKVLPLIIEFAHGSGTTDQNTSYEIVPASVTVSGDPELLKDYNNIPLRTINTTTEDFRSMNVAVTRDIVYPNGVMPLSGESEAQVNVVVNGLIVRYYSVSNLFAINRPADHRVDWITQSLDVVIRGRREDLDLISEEDIRLTADLRDLPTVTQAQRVTAMVSIDGINADIGAVDTYTLTLRLIREED